MKTWQHNQLRRALESRRAILVEEFDRDAARCLECQARHEETYEEARAGRR